MDNEDGAPKGYQDVNFPSRYRMFLIGLFRIQESFVSECLQKIYHSGRLSGTRLLDFASGPVVHRIASASLQFNDIVLAEFAEANRNEVEKWLRGDKDALDWSPLLEQCVRAEGFRDLDEGLAEIEGRIRKAVKKVVPCDALAEEILPKGLAEFDVISMSRCLETCCSTIEMYKEALKKLIKYLKKGGALVMVSALEAELTQAENTVPCIYLTEEIIKETLVETGLELRDWFCWRDTEKHEIFKYGGLSVYYAIKM